MALESFGTISAKQIDNAAKLLHDMMLESKHTSGFDPNNPAKGIMFTAGDEGVWVVEPGELNGLPAVVIKLGVG